MPVDNSETDNAFILKRQGKFSEALLAYAQRYAEVQREGNEYIAQMCFDQLVDVQLLELLRQGYAFDNLGELKRRIQIHLAEVLQEVPAFQGSTRKYFDRSWAKVRRQRDGRQLFSVGTEQLLRSKFDLEEKRA